MAAAAIQERRVMSPTEVDKFKQGHRIQPRRFAPRVSVRGQNGEITSVPAHRGIVDTYYETLLDHPEIAAGRFIALGEPGSNNTPGNIRLLTRKHEIPLPGGKPTIKVARPVIQMDLGADQLLDGAFARLQQRAVLYPTHDYQTPKGEPGTLAADMVVRSTFYMWWDSDVHRGIFGVRWNDDFAGITSIQARFKNALSAAGFSVSALDWERRIVLDTSASWQHRDDESQAWRAITGTEFKLPKRDAGFNHLAAGVDLGFERSTAPHPLPGLTRNRRHPRLSLAFTYKATDASLQPPLHAPHFGWFVDPVLAAFGQ